MMEQNEILTKERYELAMGRIREIASQEIEETASEFGAYFKEAAHFLMKMDEVFAMAVSGDLFSQKLSAKKELNKQLYLELSEENYKGSFCNPAYAVSVLGKEYGTFLAALRAELRSLIAYA